MNYGRILKIWLPMGIIVLIMALFLPLALATAFIGGGDAGACSTNDAASGTESPKPDDGNGVPEKFIPIYQDAAAKYKLGSKGPSILASIHRSESTFGDTGFGTTSTAGAVGPMQFLPSTWASVGVDGNGDGKKDVMSVEDAIFGAAHYLRVSGAPKNWNAALLSYNHSQAYVDTILSYAKKYNIPATGDVGSDDQAECEPGGESGGSVSGNVQELARQLLASQNVSFPLDGSSPNGSSEEVLKELAKGNKAPVPCTGGSTDVSIEMMRALVDAAKQFPIGINAITDKCHSSGSNHYSGFAVDLNCTPNPSKFTTVAKKYKGVNNGEICPGSSHSHYDFPPPK